MTNSPDPRTPHPAPDARPTLAEVVARSRRDSLSDPTWRTDYRDPRGEVAAEVAAGRACGEHDRPLPCSECV